MESNGLIILSVIIHDWILKTMVVTDVARLNCFVKLKKSRFN